MEMDGGMDGGMSSRYKRSSTLSLTFRPNETEQTNDFSLHGNPRRSENIEETLHSKSSREICTWNPAFQANYQHDP